MRIILKRKAFRRIFVTSIAMLIVFTFYILDIKKDDVVVNNYSYIKKQDKSNVYALSESGYLVKTSVYVNGELSIDKKVKELLEVLTKENDKNSLLPSYFNPVLPKNTKLLGVTLVDDILKINFSEEFRNASKEQFEKVIESVTYTLTDLPGVSGIEIYVVGELLKYVPNSNSSLPTVLTKDIGINKVYDVKKNSDICKVMMYFYENINDELYYVPVTKYVNDSREKIEIIVEDLSNFVYDENLVSYLNMNIKLEDYKINSGDIELVFNEEILENNDFNDYTINPILYSVFDNYDVYKVRVKAGDHKILEKLRKDIEK